MSTLLDVAISLAFVFLLFSILVSGAAELWQLIIRKRANYLFDALSAVFNDRLNKNYTQLLYDHPLIDRLKEKETTNPHYIPAPSFADALIDVIRSDNKLPSIRYNKEKKVFDVEHVKYQVVLNKDGKDEGAGVVKDFMEGVEAMNESDLKHLLRTFAFGVNDYAQLRGAIIMWFNDYMGATSTGYKRWATRTLFFIGLIVTVLFNVNAISLTKNLYKDKGLRDRVVDAAIQYAEKKQKEREDSAKKVAIAKEQLRAAQDSVQADTTNAAGKADTTRVKETEDDQWKRDMKEQSDRIRDAYDEVSALNLPIGWAMPDNCKGKAWYCWIVLVFIEILKSIPGWLISAAALSYGADNWFNLLTRLVNIRTSVKPKDNESQS